MSEVSNISVNASEAVPAIEEMKDKRPNEASATDTAGRLIVVRRSTPLDLFRLTKIYGDKATQATLNLATVVTSVMSIDGDRIVPPGTDRQIEALMLRLDWHGFNTAAALIKQLDPPSTADDLDLAKN